MAARLANEPEDQESTAASPPGPTRGPSPVAVVVDVLSFTTTVTLATARGARVHPHRGDDGSARRRAEDLGVRLAVRRTDNAPGTGGVGLSPSSVVEAVTVSDLLLPSPNGSTVAAVLQDSGAHVVAGCLLNASAVGRWLRVHRAQGAADTVLLVPAGERWPDGSLRPAYEDLWGAGAVIAALALPADDLSMEAQVALAAFRAVESDLSAALHACASGRELTARGYGEDVRIAAAHDTVSVVPVLRDGYFSASPA